MLCPFAPVVQRIGGGFVFIEVKADLFWVEDESFRYRYYRQQGLPRGLSRLHFRPGVGQSQSNEGPASRISVKASHPQWKLQAIPTE